jgi:hypothetical protein
LCRISVFLYVEIAEPSECQQKLFQLQLLNPQGQYEITFRYDSTVCSLPFHRHQHPNFISHKIKHTKQHLMMHLVHLESPVQGRHLENGTAPNYYSPYLMTLCFHLKTDKTLYNWGYTLSSNVEVKLYDVKQQESSGRKRNKTVAPAVCQNYNVTQCSKCKAKL